MVRLPSASVGNYAWGATAKRPQPMLRGKRADAFKIALELLAPAGLTLRESVKPPEGIWHHPYVVGFVTAICVVATKIAYQRNPSSHDSRAVLREVYRKVFRSSADTSELFGDAVLNDKEFIQGWENGMLIIGVLTGELTRRNEPRVAEALGSGNAGSDDQRAAEVAVQVLWAKHFDDRIRTLASVGPESREKKESPDGA